MKTTRYIILLFILTLFLGSCYTGEVVTINTITDEQQPIETPTIIEPIIITPTPEQQPTITEPKENRYIAPETTITTYTGTVLVKTGPSSYRVRLPTNRELRILTREQLQPDDKITFTIDSEGTATILAITERPTDRTRY